MPNLVYIQ